MKLRKRERNTNSTSSSVLSSHASSSVSSSSVHSTASTSSSAGSTSISRAGKRQTATRGRSRVAKKILKDKNEPVAVEQNAGESLLMDKIASVFQKSQHLQHHGECVEKLRELYHSTEHDEFCSKLAHFVRIVLRNDVKSPFTKNSLVFIQKLINTLDNEKRVIPLKEDETIDELAESIFGEEMSIRQELDSKECVLDYILSEVATKELLSTDSFSRQNTCALIFRLLNRTKDINETVYKNLLQLLVELQADRNPLFRTLVAYALGVFQDTSVSRCPVITCFSFHINKDPAYQVRGAILKMIVVKPETLYFIIKLTRDVKPVIRKQAYIKLADQVSLGAFTSTQRMNLLKEGLNDRHEIVRRVVEERLLASWLRDCEGDLVNLMNEINMKDDTKMAKRVFNIFANQFIEIGDEQFGTKFHALAHSFRESYLDDEKLLTNEHQTPEKVFVWQCLNTFIKSNEDKFIKRADANFSSNASDQLNNTVINTHEKSNEDESKVDDWADQTLTEDSNQGKDDSHISDYLFPELPHICQYLEKFVDSIDANEFAKEELDDKEFVYNQMISLLLLYDICDEAQQNYILEMIRTIIFSPNLHLVFRDSISPIMKFISRRIFKDSNHLMEFTAECTSKVYNIAAEVSVEENVPELKTPEPSGSVEPTFDADYARITMEIEEFRDQLDKAISEQDFMTAQNIKNQLDELANKRERLQNIRLEQKSTSTQSQQIPPSQVPPTEPFNIKDHPGTLLKCLQIFVGALTHGKFVTANALIFSHIDQIVLPCICNKDDRIRSYLVKALGLSSIVSESLFRQNGNLLLQISKHDLDQSIKAIALQAFFDCLCKHGIEPLIRKNKAIQEERRTSKKRIEEDIANISLAADDDDLLEMGSIGDAETQADIHRSMMEGDDEGDDEQPDAETSVMSRERSRAFEALNTDSEQDIINSLIQLFTEMFFNSEIDLIEEIAVEGFAKLMILGIIYSPSLLSRLIIIWYLPETKRKVQQFLGVFLPIYIGSESKYVREDDHITVTGQTCLLDCFIDTLEVLYEAKYCLDKDPEDFRLFEYLPNLDRDTPYKQIDLKNVASFMLSLLRPSHHKHLLSNLIHKMYSIVTSSDSEFKFYEDFLSEFLLKVCLRLSIDEIDDTVFSELRPVMQKLIVKVKSRLNNMRALSRKKMEKFIRSFSLFYKSLGRGELNASLSQGSGEAGEEVEGAADLDEQMDEELNLDPLGPELSDNESNDGKDKLEGEEEDEEEEDTGGDDINDELDALDADVPETLRWSDLEDNDE